MAKAKGKRKSTKGRKKGRRSAGVKALVTRAINNRFKQEYTHQMQGADNVTAGIGKKLTFVTQILGGTTDVYDMFKMAVSPTSALNANATTDNFNLDRSILEYNITNHDVHQAHMTIYYCRPRRDIPNVTTLNSIPNILQNGWQASGLAAVESGTTKGYESSLTITPFMSPTFVRWFHVYKVKKLHLRAGENFLLRISNGKTKKIQGSYLLPDETQLAYTNVATIQIKGLTKFAVIQIHGQATQGTATGGGPGAIATADIKLNMVWTKKYTFSKIPHQTSRNYDVVGVLGNVTADEAPTDVTAAGTD